MLSFKGKTLDRLEISSKDLSFLLDRDVKLINREVEGRLIALGVTDIDRFRTVKVSGSRRYTEWRLPPKLAEYVLLTYDLAEFKKLLDRARELNSQNN